VSLAELRLHLPRPRTDVRPRQGLAVITWCVLGDGPAVVCGVLAAVVGPVVEIALVEVGVFRYAESCDQLFGVGPWLVPLYFAFGVVAALLGELAARSDIASETVRGLRLHYP
jgi:hypothetical protein